MSPDRHAVTHQAPHLLQIHIELVCERRWVRADVTNEERPDNRAAHVLRQLALQQALDESHLRCVEPGRRCISLVEGTVVGDIVRSEEHTSELQSLAYL